MANLTRQNVTQIQNGISCGIFNVTNPYSLDVFQAPHFTYNEVPIAPSNTYVAASQAITGGTALTLNSANFVTLFGNQQVVRLDCPRVLTFIPAGTTTTAAVITYTGYDARLVAVTGTITMPIGTTIAGVVGLKALKYVTSVTLSANPGFNVSVGISGTTFGLPVFIPNKQYIYRISWNGALLDTYGAGVVTTGNQFNSLSSPYITAPTAASLDARGLVTVPSAADGAQMLSVYGYVYGADSQLYAKMESSDPNEVTAARAQTLIGQGNLKPIDEVGYQFPGTTDIYSAI